MGIVQLIEKFRLFWVVGICFIEIICLFFGGGIVWFIETFRLFLGGGGLFG